MICYVVCISIVGSCTGGDSCCSPINKCEADDGDCDTDDDCKAGLKCGTKNCKEKSGLHWDSDDDCCYEPDDDKPRA